MFAADQVAKTGHILQHEQLGVCLQVAACMGQQFHQLRLQLGMALKQRLCFCNRLLM